VGVIDASDWLGEWTGATRGFLGRGIGIGYREGWGGCGVKPLLLVKGCVAKGSKESRRDIL